MPDVAERLGDLMVQSWKRHSFAIAMEDGKVRVDGITIGERQEIGLHFGVTAKIDATHIPSGKKIGSFDTLGAAVEFAHRVVNLRDWANDRITGAEYSAILEVYTTVRNTERRPEAVK